MQKTNAEILNHFYGLLIEINFHQADDEIAISRNYKNDPLIQKHLQRIKLKTAKYKALLNKSRYQLIIAEIQRLKEIGFEEIKKLLNPQEAIRLQPLFRKFEEISQKDEASICEDEELLQLITSLKDKLDKAEDE